MPPTQGRRHNTGPSAGIPNSAGPGNTGRPPVGPGGAFSDGARVEFTSHDITDQNRDPFAPSEMDPFRGTSPIDVSTAVGHAIQDACDFIDGYIAPYRTRAIEYYRGQPFGNEEEGRSQIVMTEVRDTIQAMLPDLLRIFTSSDRVVEFLARTAGKVSQAEQATDLVNYIFYSENDGFSLLYAAFKDALTIRSGVFKWRWDDSAKVTEADYENLSHEQIALLMMDNEVQIVSMEPQPAVQSPPPLPPNQQAGEPPKLNAAPPQQQPFGGQDQLFNVKIRRTTKRDTVVVETLPPEEFICSRLTRELDTSPFVGHRSLKTKSDLVAMGYDPDTIEANLGAGDLYLLNYEAQIRNPAVNSFLANDPSNSDESQRLALYVEGYVRLDEDNDGIAELRRICTVGPGYHILYDEIAEEVPMAYLCPDPQPHTLFGHSIADQTMDLQLLKSNVMRALLDSLAQTIHPRTWVVEGQVNLDDAMNTETGAVVRIRQPGMIGALNEPFVGQGAMPVLTYLDELRAQRTGVSQISQGLNADILQSTTPGAVEQAQTGAQERTEMVARFFANGIERMFRGILKLVCKHMDRPKVIRLRNKWVEIDPRYWDADLDVVTNVALGRGSDQQRLAFLTAIAAKQELILQTTGPSNPLVNLQQYGNTLGQLCELAGFKDSQKYFNQIDDNLLQQIEQSSKQPPKPTPNELIAQAEIKKAEDAGNKSRAELMFDTAKLEAETNFNYAKLHAESLLRVAEMEAKYKTTVDVKAIEVALAQDKLMAENARTAANILHEQGTQADEMFARGHEGTSQQRHETALERLKNELRPKPEPKKLN